MVTHSWSKPKFFQTNLGECQKPKDGQQGLSMVPDCIVLGRKDMDVGSGLGNTNVKMAGLVGVGETNKGVCGQSGTGWRWETM